MKNNNTKVSIIIPCFNQGQYVAEAIEFARYQTYENIEIICIDDGSTDDTKNILRNYEKKYENIKAIYNEKNMGVVYSRNIAIDTAEGEYILPLDADDKIDPTYVEKAVKVLDEKPEIGIVYCRAQLFGSQYGSWELPDFDFNKFLYDNCIFATALFRKSDFLRAGKYKEYMKVGAEDWDLWMSFIELGLQPYRIDEALFYYRQYKQKTRSDYAKKNIDKILANLLRNHINLYLNDKSFLYKAFYNDDRYVKKFKRYKKLFNIFLPVSIIEFIFIILLVILRGI